MVFTRLFWDAQTHALTDGPTQIQNDSGRIFQQCCRHK